ncbi:MAG: histidine kinase [Bacteroidota bacterium]
MKRIRKSGKFALAFLLTVMAIVVVNYIRCPNCFADRRDTWFTVIFTIFISIALWLANGYVQDFLDKYVSWLERPVKRLILGVLLMIVCTWIIAAIIGWAFWYVVIGYSMQRFFTQVMPDLSITVIAITAVISIITHGRSFLLNWRKAALELETVKREKIASQYQSLKDQLNPHFLFNNLNSLTALIHKDPDNAVAFVKKLSQVYRYVLENSPKEVIPLTEELGFIGSYLHLLHIRFGKALQVVQEVENKEQFVIPPLTLQLLVENAVKHNILSSSKPMKLEIIKEEPQYLTVRNTLQKKWDVTPSSGIGLQNIRNRLKFLTDLPLIVLEEEDVFIVKVPLLSLSTAGRHFSPNGEVSRIPSLETLNPEA